MKIGYSSRWHFVHGDKTINIFKELEYAHYLGFEVFGLNLDRDHNRSMGALQLWRLRKKANAFGMSIIVRSPHHLNTSVESEELLKQVRRNIRIAKSVGSDRLMIHPGHILDQLQLDSRVSSSYKGKRRKDFDITEDQIEKRRGQLISNLQLIIQMCKRSGIQLALENNGEYYQFGSNIKEFELILNQVPGLKVSISTGHANISRNNVYRYISKFKDKIINLDLHDNNGKKDDHKPMGDGNIDFLKILKALNKNPNLTLLIDTYTNQLTEKSLENVKQIISRL